MLNLYIFNIFNIVMHQPLEDLFPDSATPQMEGLVELHDNIMFYLVLYYLV